MTAPDQHRRAERAWCLYDWANSAFATVVLSAVLPVYFAAIAPPGGMLLGGRTVPATAVLSAPYGDSVFVVAEKTAEDGTKTRVAEQRFVRTGRSMGDFVAVTEGLKAGETVVTAGVFKLRNGAAIEVNNKLAPEPSLTPVPADT